jgi:hypothetical protein
MVLNKVLPPPSFLPPPSSLLTSLLSSLLPPPSFLPALNALQDHAVVIEDPTYWLVVPMFERRGGRLERIPMDEEGMRVDLLEERLRAGLKVRYGSLLPLFFLSSSSLLSPFFLSPPPSAAPVRLCLFLLFACPILPPSLPFFVPLRSS